jgi:hypothetical protein
MPPAPRKEPLMADEGAIFEGRIDQVEGKFQANIYLQLDSGESTFTESYIRVFDTRDDALTWFDAEARLRGFRRYKLVEKIEKAVQGT